MRELRVMDVFVCLFWCICVYVCVEGAERELGSVRTVLGVYSHFEELKFLI